MKIIFILLGLLVSLQTYAQVTQAYDRIFKDEHDVTDESWAYAEANNDPVRCALRLAWKEIDMFKPNLSVTYLKIKTSEWGNSLTPTSSEGIMKLILETEGASTSVRYDITGKALNHKDISGHIYVNFDHFGSAEDKTVSCFLTDDNNVLDNNFVIN